MVGAVMDEEGGGRKGRREMCVGRGGTNQNRCGEKKIKISVTGKMRSRAKWMNGQRPDWTLVLNHFTPQYNF